jgi:hypothetical protein
MKAMRMKYCILLGVLFLLVGTSCKRKKLHNTSRLVFGTYYSKSPGKSATLYCVDKATLSTDDSVKDISVHWPVFSPTRILDESKFRIASGLLYQVPDELHVNGGRTFGCPDCHGQGGMFIEVEDEARGAYRIDLDDTKDQSEAIVVFKQKVLETIQKLK